VEISRLHHPILQPGQALQTFVKEQIAGDEMAEGNRSERLIALGFLRMGTWEADVNFKTQLRQDVLNELTGTVGQVFLGFTVGCARCHDHKYDPIPQRDFYRLQAFFAPMRVEDRAAPFIESEHPKSMRANQRKYEDQSDDANEALKTIEAGLKSKFETAHKGSDFMKALKDTKDAAFTPEERKQWTEARDNGRKLGELAARYRAMAYQFPMWCPLRSPPLPILMSWPAGNLPTKAKRSSPVFYRQLLEMAIPPKSPSRAAVPDAVRLWPSGSLLPTIR
jgi:hypothetical protein